MGRYRYQKRQPIYKVAFGADCQEKEMNMRQLFEQGIRKIRLPVWNKFAYLELIEPIPGQLAPFGKLWDIGCAGRDVPLWQAESDEYEEWTDARLEGLTQKYIHVVYYNEE